MREIKFRAWSIKENEMINDVFVVDTRTQHLMPLMQYTGLKDKNGKEIYEGDICREVFQGEYVGEVTFSPTQGYLVGNRPIWPHDIEVIGNIYENGDLLK